jgi:hypothetical protein
VIQFHRVSWCPYHNVQRAAVARAADKFAQEGIKVISVSVDDREKSEAFVKKHKVGFPVVYGTDARAVSAATGAFANDDPICLQAIGPQSRRPGRNDDLFDPRDRPSAARRCAGHSPLLHIFGKELRDSGRLARRSMSGAFLC